ncbi:hypothetical protein JW960_09270 [candidate division KSB1 bacterium]|nr:hypothetical protein [candidate division KSB1 bacterium]
MKKVYLHTFHVVSIVLSFCCFLAIDTSLVFAQDSLSVSTSDSTKIPYLSMAADSLAPADSVHHTSRIHKSTSVDMDTTLYYDARIIDIRVPERITYLVGNAVVKYKTMTLNAEKITVNWNNNELVAEGIPDTTWKFDPQTGDSLADVKWRGTPVVSEKGQTMNGFQMYYNFKSAKARVIRGRSKYDNGNYYGESMKKVGKEIINISNGYFTSCENEDNPHFHFGSRRIKVIPKDKVIAKPVVLYLGHIPVGIIPFAVFPNKTGRQSGLVIPSYGQSHDEGRFIRGLGYYWAPSDYYDARGLVDYYDLSGWLLRGDLNYAKRYVLNGKLSGSYTQKLFTNGTEKKRWDLVVRHNHTINPTMTLRVDGKFISDDTYYKDYTPNLTERLNREIRSNATFSKNWRDQRMNMSVNLSHVRDIDDKRTTLTLPQMSFSVSQRKLFGDNSRSGSSAGSQKDHWYNAIYYNYSNSLTNNEVRYDKNVDSTLASSSRRNTLTRYWDHRGGLSFNAPQKVLGILNIGLSTNVISRMYDRYHRNTFNYETNTVEIDTVQGFAAKTTFSTSVNTSTKIYGYVEPNIGKVKAIRHVITPNVRFSYAPDFSDPKWGYVDEFQDINGKAIKASRFTESVSGSESKSMSISLENLFQMKTMDGEKEKKFDIFALNSSTNYNFTADKNKWSSIGSSIRSSALRKLNMNISMTHDWYRYEDNRRTNKIMLLEDKPLLKRQFLRLTNFRVSTSFRLQGKSKASDTTKRTKESAFTEGEQVTLSDDGNVMPRDEYLNQTFSEDEDRFDPEAQFSGSDISWRANISLEYNLNKSNPDNPNRTFYMNLSGAEIQLTKNWRINYSARYDLKDSKLINHSFAFYRAMHCWEARFDWRPSGIGAPYFYFRINVRSPQLKDLKYEKRGGRNSVIRY